MKTPKASHITVQRLESWLNEIRLNRTDFMKMMGVYSQQYNNWRNRGIPVRVMDEIANKTGISYKYLRHGEGHKSTGGTVSMSVTETVGAYNIEVVQQKHFAPLISWVRAGEFCEAHDPLESGDAEDWYPRPKGASEKTYCLRVVGDSMTSPYPGSRSYPNGVIIFVDPEKEVLPGSRGIFKLPDSNQVTFKELVSDAGNLFLKPLNPQYDKIPATDKMTTCGKVIGSFFPE